MVITDDLTIYTSISPCDDKGYSRTEYTDKIEWFELNRQLNLIEFAKIDLNSCNVCVDGCDSWVSIRNGSFYHKIRFGYQDSIAIQKIRPFIDLVDSIRCDFRKKP